jgi:hypothetical protein
VKLKLQFSEKRLNELEYLIANNQLTADPNTRHQLTQEFFFHLLGATDYLAQLVNERLLLGLINEQVALYKVVEELSRQNVFNNLISELRCLCADTKKKTLPQNPYSDEGLIYRAINYRNEVVHKAINPFHFVLSAGPKTAYFWLDPRNQALGKSERSVDVELKAMYDLVNTKCQNSFMILE